MFQLITLKKKLIFKTCIGFRAIQIEEIAVFLKFLGIFAKMVDQIENSQAKIGFAYPIDTIDGEFVDDPVPDAIRIEGIVARMGQIQNKPVFESLEVFNAESCEHKLSPLFPSQFYIRRNKDTIQVDFYSLLNVFFLR